MSEEGESTPIDAHVPIADELAPETNVPTDADATVAAEVAAASSAASSKEETAEAAVPPADLHDGTAAVDVDAEAAVIHVQDTVVDGQEVAVDGQEVAVDGQEVAVDGEVVDAVDEISRVESNTNTEATEIDAAAPSHVESSQSLSEPLKPSTPPAAPAASEVAPAPIKTKGSAQYPLAELTQSGELPYYTPAQVASHGVAADCWLSFLGKVIDISELVRREHPELMQSIVAAAGSDISHWFTKDGELKTVYDLQSGLRRYQTPGDLPLLHAPPPHPTATFDMSFEEPWWRQQKLMVGNLTQKTRKLRVVNMLLSSSHVIDVCAEQKIRDINDLYRSYNAHSGSYTWKQLNKQGKMEILDANKTLQENGLPDMSQELAELLIDEAEFLPAVYLYFNDDLTKA